MRYATKEDVAELSKQVTELAKAITELAKWNLLVAVERKPHSFPEFARKQILKETEEFPMIHAAISEIFRLHNPSFSKNSLHLLPKG